MPAIVVALFLAAHGLIHLAYLAPPPPAKPGSPAWPFDTSHSRLLGARGSGVLRIVGRILAMVSVAGFALAALAFLGVGPADWFGPAVVAASVASLALLGVFFHPWLVLGIAIDGVLLWAVLVNGWGPAGGS